MPTKRAVFFDFGGTLYDYEILRHADRESLIDLFRWLGIKTKPFRIQQVYRDAMRAVFRRYLPEHFYLHRDLFRDALIMTLKEFGKEAHPDQLQSFLFLQWKRYARDLKIREGVVSTLSKLRNRGFHLGLVSNVDEDQLSYLFEAVHIDRYFDFVLSSEEAKSCKPDPVIFAEALTRAGCRPEEAFFVGDSLLQDIAGANNVGIHSVLLWHRDDRKPPDTDPRPCHVIRYIPELLALV